HLGLGFLHVHAALLGDLLQKLDRALRACWTWQHRIHRDPCAGDALRDAAGAGKLGCLGHAVMHRLSRDVQPRRARDKNKADTSSLEHVRKERPREAYPTHHVCFEEAQPIGIGNLEKRLRFEDTDIVHEDVDISQLAQETVDTWGTTKIGGNAARSYPHGPTRNAFDRVNDLLIGPTIDHDLSPLPR